MKNKMFYIDKNETIEDILKQIKEFFEYDSGIVCDEDGKVAYFKEDTFNQLLDYITNLQEENERYKRIFEGKERFSKIMPDDTDFIILSKADYDRQQEENERLKKDNLLLIDYQDMEQKYDDYKLRNEKAIEYIKHEWFKREQIGISHLSFSYDELQKILNILNGGDEE